MKLRSSNSTKLMSRRRSSPKLNLPESAGKLAAEAYRRFVSLVVETSQRTQRCFHELISLQKGLMQGVQDFLALDAAIVDEAAMALVQECQILFEALDAVLARSHGFQQAADSGKDTLAELDKLLALLSRWAEASSEQEHYVGKVASLEKQGNAEKMARNRDKLEHAKHTVNGYQQAGDAALTDFGEMCTVYVRATLIAHLRTFAQVLADIGTQASPAAADFAAELQEGARVQIVALRRARELNGLEVFVQGPDLKDPGRSIVSLPDGEQKSVRNEHLQPIVNSSPTAAGSRSSTSNPLSDSAAHCSPEASGSTSMAAAASASAGEGAESVPEAPERVNAEPKPGESFEGQDSPELEPEHEPPRIGFGACGRSVKLLKAPAALGVLVDSEWMSTIAERTHGLLHGVSFTSAALRPCLSVPGVRRFYFEFSVLEAMSRGTSRTLSMGFAWPPTPEQADSRGGWDEEGLPIRSVSRDSLLRRVEGQEAKASRSLPESSTQLPYAFVVGGDLPRAYLGARDLGKVSGWRPLREAKPGSRLGCLLEQDWDLDSCSNWRLSVLLDGTRRCCIEAEPPNWGPGAPHGLVDVCGSVKRVRLMQTLEPPPEIEDAPNVGRLLISATAASKTASPGISRTLSSPASMM